MVGTTFIWLTIFVFVLTMLALARQQYPIQTLQTSHFVVTVPRPWLEHSIYIVALLELCYQTAVVSLSLLPVSDAQQVDIRPSWRPAFWFQPHSHRIVLCFLFGPAIDRWLFSVYFAIAHEYGHALSQREPQTANEAWANWFSLTTLRILTNDQSRWQWWEYLLIRRDTRMGLMTLQVWRIMPGERRQIAEKFWQLWRAY